MYFYNYVGICFRCLLNCKNMNQWDKGYYNLKKACEVRNSL